MNISENELEQRIASRLMDVLIRAALIFMLALLCYRIFAPFLSLMGSGIDPGRDTVSRTSGLGIEAGGQAGTGGNPAGDPEPCPDRRPDRSADQFPGRFGAVAEHERIVSTNRVEFIIITLKITRSTDESYLRSQTALLLSLSSPATTNHALKIVRMVFRSARREGSLFQDPAEGVRSVKSSAQSDRAHSPSMSFGPCSRLRTRNGVA